MVQRALMHELRQRKGGASIWPTRRLGLAWLLAHRMHLLVAMTTVQQTAAAKVLRDLGLEWGRLLSEMPVGR
jgi:hypothetical protein